MVLCSAGGGAFASFSYGDNQQFISVADGNFSTIAANGGDDSFTVLGGSLFALTGGDGDDQFVISNGVINQVVGGGGDDAIFVNGGTVSVVSGGTGADLLVSNGGTTQLLSGSEGADEIVVNGGTVTSVAGGPDRDLIRLLGGTVTNVRGNDGRDTVFLGPGYSVSGLLDGGDGTDQLQLQAGTASHGGEPQNFEILVIENGANWTLTGTTLNFTSGILYESQAANALTVASGSTLTTGIIQLRPVNSLIVDGTLTASSILSAGTIGGSGTINPGGTLRLVDGILSPGSSIGTLTINQTLQLAGNPVLLIEMDPAATPKNDLLAVNGDVIGTNDLTIQVVALNGALTADDYTAANTYQVLTASGSIDGDNPTVTLDGSMPALLAVNIVGTPSADGEIVLNFTNTTATQFAKKAKDQTGNPNHQTIASSIITAATTTPSQQLVISTPSGTMMGPTISSAVNSLTNTQLSQLNAVHAEPYASHMSLGLEQMELVSNMVMDHASGTGLPFQGSPSAGGMMSLAPDLRSGQVASAEGSYGAVGQTARSIKPEPSPDYDRVWLDVGLVDGDVEGDGGLGDYDYRVYGLAMGADLYNSEDVTAGLFAGIGRSDMDDHEVGEQEFESDVFYLGAYGQYRFEADWALSGMLGYMYSDTDAKRSNPTIGSFTGGLAEADYESHGVFAGLKAHRPYELSGGFVATPAAGIVYSHLWQESIQETGGGAFNYSIEEETADSLITSIGVDVTKAFEQGRKTWYPVAFARYEYDWLAASDDSHDISVSNPNFGTFTQVGQNRGEHGVVAGAGLAVTIDEKVSIGAGYAYSWRSNGTEHGLGASLTVTW